jgi:hypothetical protein
MLSRKEAGHMWLWRGLGSLLAVVAVWQCVALADGALPRVLRVLFDEAHDEINTISESRARQINSAHPEFYYFGSLAEAVSADYSLERGVTRFDSAYLAGFDVVILSTPRAAFQQAELDALKTFVEGGGGLLVLQDLDPSPTIGSNQIAKLFDLEFRPGALLSRNGDWDAGSFRVEVVQSDHFIVQGSDGFQMNWGCSIVETTDSVVLLKSNADTWQDSNGNQRTDTDEPSGPLPVAVALEAGKGRVILVADNAFHDNIWSANRTFFMNALRWLSGTTAGTVALGTSSFAVDPDVTIDSVVQIGDGPQELTTKIKLYPSTRRTQPGQTVYWTLDLGDLEGPFTVVPEMDNDNVRETAIQTTESKVVIAHSYTAANVYVPYVQLRSGDGAQQTVYTTNVLAVVPDLAQRTGIGLKLPTPEDPVGDVIKGIEVYGTDAAVFDTENGRQSVLDKIRAWSAAGANFAVVNIVFFLAQEDSNVTLPRYKNIVPPTWTETLPIRDLIWLTDWLHGNGIRVAWKFQSFLGEKLDCTALTPSDLDLYLEYLLGIKTAYAAIAQALAVESIGLEMENPTFTASAQSVAVIDAVRSVYSGILFDSPRGSQSMTYSSPLWPYLDLMCISIGPETIDNLQGYPTEELKKAFMVQYYSELLPPMYEFNKPGFFVLFFSNEADSGAYQSRAYTAVFEVMRGNPSLLMGISIWDDSLSPHYPSPCTPFGHPAEQVLGEYFNVVFPDTRAYCFENIAPAPALLSALEDFETTTGQYTAWGNFGVASTQRDRSLPFSGQYSLKLSFESHNKAGDFAHSVLEFRFQRSQDWRPFRTLNFQMRNDGNPTWFIVSVFDQDGDQFIAQLSIQYPRENEWMPYSVMLDQLVNPPWAGRGNGAFDLSKVVKLQVLEMFFDELDHQTWYDHFYLGGPL